MGGNMRLGITGNLESVNGATTATASSRQWARSMTCTPCMYACTYLCIYLPKVCRVFTRETTTITTTLHQPQQQPGYLGTYVREVLRTLVLMVHR